jgi:rubrerythrin
MQYYNGYPNRSGGTYPTMPQQDFITQYDIMQNQYLYDYPQNLPMALELIRGAVEGEREDEMFYDYLISVAPSDEDKNIIIGIRDDERKHFMMFRQIYCELTGQMLPPPTESGFEFPETFCAGVKKALQGELGAVQRYRKILFAMISRRHINMLTEIITDELRHANLYNLLYSMNQCFM